MAVDAILPPRLIRESTYEERKEMNRNISRLVTPSVLHISAMGFICLVNGACLYTLTRKKK